MHIAALSGTESIKRKIVKKKPKHFAAGHLFEALYLTKV